MATGENEQGLRKIMDFTRLLSIAILVIHFYLLCYAAFREWELTTSIVDRILSTFSNMKIFKTILASKVASLLLLAVSLLGVKGKKDEKIEKRTAIVYILTGLILFFISQSMLLMQFSVSIKSGAYIGITSIGYFLILTGGTLLSRLIKLSLQGDIFNKLNETFPQEERLLENEYSINLPAHYNLKGKIRKSWINIINPFRGSLVLGTPGSGKSYFAIRHIITQHIKKGFSIFLYDFKYDDLTIIAYNTLLNNNSQYPVKPKFYVINFEDLSRTHRCNPLDPASMTDITDATEASRTIMLGLNRAWIKKQGDFFVESPINFLTAIIWFLRKYQDGTYCTLPHVIELMQVEYKYLFAVLLREPEIEVLINPFISAWQNEAYDQLEGQVASAKISMARLSSPALYYVLSGNDFTLGLNNPEEPKIICMGNNPQKQQVYGAVLSLYISRMIKLVNQKNKLKCSLIFDEFPTIYFNNIDSLIATARSNKVATTLAVQDYSQLKKDYGREQAEVIMNIVGNIISGQVTGDTAKQLSERFGKIIQERQSVSINSSDTSVSRSTQLDYAIPASKISSLSSGEFVGMVADNPDNKIDLKVFHSEIQNDHEAIRQEEAQYEEIPKIRTIDSDIVQINYLQIKQDIQELLVSELGSVAEDKSTIQDRTNASGGGITKGMRL
ncbi:MAG: conjugal transfer protein TraG [Sphingobacteriales bacterium 17-39-43]|uniref:conjugal transfer protein MobC n=1 Tax=Daejeonella sp. TaxID=2805397 RepID=UPI000BD074EB|nr:conjugal transfer protein MobC [Daejeonella sp.]OYZ33245.1 MAG: conjugal transfer protein TraG [Sphingobacteriales bacterium 16-39-50]OZA26654.1 MAG: conjugal transfer protein TraG [Sphingobacteriales bacterium 17-39-43]HQT21818.1 conjugal transfer protein MobC [Daejeonella sp.]HQT56549.1 conjugal transfer protein MobC [Daejeonella sp.]